MSKRISRRDAIRRTLFGASGVTLGALATGLPASFLLDRRVAEADADALPTYTILSTSSTGHPLNANMPGTYPNSPDDMGDPLRLIDHPQVSELGAEVIGTIGGVPITAADFQDPADVRLGSQSFKAAGAWGALDASLRERMAFIHHATYAAAHSEHGNVMKFHGAIRSPSGTGSEMLASMIAQENAPRLGTLTDKPINVGGGLTTVGGRPLGKINPEQLQSLFAPSEHPTQVDPARITRLRDAVIDRIYGDLRTNGSHAQRAFLDHYAISRRHAAELGASLSPLLEGVSGTTSRDQVLAAVALLKQNMTPVVVLDLRAGGDNHSDSDLRTEVEETVEHLDAIQFLWERLQAEGLADRTTYVYLDVFGRNLLRSDGRNHNRGHHGMMMFGPRVRPSVVGGLVPFMRNGRIRDFHATDIGDVPFEQTLESAGKTLAAAIGIPQDRIDTRIAGGRVLTDAIV